MAISYPALRKEKCSISNIIQIILILVSVFLSLKYKYCIIGRHFFLYIFILISILVVLHLWSHSNFLLSIRLLSGDAEMNPESKLISKESFLICHRNLNSITAHNYTKRLLLKTYIAVYNFNIICLSETYLDSKTLPDDDNLHILGYNFVRYDHPFNSKRGRVCIYYKETLSLRVIIVNYLSRCIRFKLNIGEKLCSFISLCRSSIQTQDEFDKFADNLELNVHPAVQKNPYLVVVFGHFNAKSKSSMAVIKLLLKRMF